MTKQDDYLSLYDYLGRAAGPSTGESVKKYADENGVPFSTKQINNGGYKGTILTYPKSFLELYFREPDIEPTLGDIQDNDLPF
tara:strand:+ start:581 stop:829 length:249 start_codon:yes stop_codon:yes gene_type:complete